MKPMIKYRGGKSKEIPNIMWHIPRFTGRYIEPFFGGGALFFYLENPDNSLRFWPHSERPSAKYKNACRLLSFC